MKFARFPRRRSLKFASFSIIALLFLFTNLIGLLFSPAFAPSADARTRELNNLTPTLEDVIPADIPSSGDHNLDLIIYKAGEKYGVDPRFIHAVIWQESKYKSEARSQMGAQGLMQLMPDTAKRFGCGNANDVSGNIDAGTKYLRWLLERFDGNVSLALAGYNAGEGAVDKYDGVPPFSETQNYVKIITSRYGKLFHPVLQPQDAMVAFSLTPQAAFIN
jgi:soluble lytic murein transglycosylase-like protein